MPLTTRRIFIRRIALLAGGGVATSGFLTVARAAPPPKLSQSDSGYRNKPKGAQRCDLCVNWRAPDSCKVVAGVINATGLCSLFALKR